MSEWLESLPSVWWWLVHVLLGEGILACWAFVILYSVSAKWWRTEFGRHLIAVSVSLGLFLTYYGLLVFWPDMPGRNPIRALLFVFLIVVINQRLWVFGRYDLARRRERRRQNRGES